MEKRPRENGMGTGRSNGPKRARSSKACAQCRKQKARCENEGGYTLPCHRCKVLSLHCSFLDDAPPDPPSPPTRLQTTGATSYLQQPAHHPHSVTHPQPQPQPAPSHPIHTTTYPSLTGVDDLSFKDLHRRMIPPHHAHQESFFTSQQQQQQSLVKDQSPNTVLPMSMSNTYPPQRSPRYSRFTSKPSNESFLRRAFQTSKEPIEVLAKPDCPPDCSEHNDHQFSSTRSKSESEECFTDEELHECQKDTDREGAHPAPLEVWIRPLDLVSMLLTQSENSRVGEEEGMDSNSNGPNAEGTSKGRDFDHLRESGISEESFLYMKTIFEELYVDWMPFKFPESSTSLLSSIKYLLTIRHTGFTVSSNQVDWIQNFVFRQIVKLLYTTPTEEEMENLNNIKAFYILSRWIPSMICEEASPLRNRNLFREWAKKILSWQPSPEKEIDEDFKRVRYAVCINEAFHQCLEGQIPDISILSSIEQDLPAPSSQDCPLIDARLVFQARLLIITEKGVRSIRNEPMEMTVAGFDALCHKSDKTLAEFDLWIRVFNRNVSAMNQNHTPYHSTILIQQLFCRLVTLLHTLMVLRNVSATGRFSINPEQMTQADKDLLDVYKQSVHHMAMGLIVTLEGIVISATAGSTLTTAVIGSAPDDLLIIIMFATALLIKYHHLCLDWKIYKVEHYQETYRLLDLLIRKLADSSLTEGDLASRFSNLLKGFLKVWQEKAIDKLGIKGSPAVTASNSDSGCSMAQPNHSPFIQPPTPPAPEHLAPQNPRPAPLPQPPELPTTQAQVIQQPPIRYDAPIYHPQTPNDPTAFGKYTYTNLLSSNWAATNPVDFNWSLQTFGDMFGNGLFDLGHDQPGVVPQERNY